MNTTMTNRIDDINELLGGEEFKAVFINPFKNNGNWEGVALEGVNMNAAPIIYYNNEIWKKTDQEVADYFKNIYARHSSNVDISSLLSREYILDHVLPRVYSRDNIPELNKREIAYTSLLDMVVVYYIPVDGMSTCHELASVSLTSPLLKKVGLDLDELLRTATLHVEETYHIQKIEDVLSAMLGAECPVEDEQMPTMLIVSSTLGVNGAGVIVSKNILNEVANILGSRYAILPSSIHELLCLAYKSDDDLQKLFHMVQDINAEHVLPEEKLTDNVYTWNNGELQQFVS